MEEEIIFPENLTSIMDEILEKYGRGESSEEAFEKIMKDVKTNREKLSDIILDWVYKKITIEKLPKILEKEFELSPLRAKLMARDIQREILDQIKRKGEEKPEKRDIYREPIE